MGPASCTLITNKKKQSKAIHFNSTVAACEVEVSVATPWRSSDPFVDDVHCFCVEHILPDFQCSICCGGL